MTLCFSIRNALCSLSLIFLLLTSSCSIEPSPIKYGSDACFACSMNIVDQQHAAEYVTPKGRSFKFDAIECMVNTLRNKDDGDPLILLVADYSNPGMLIPAKNATYLISEGIKSPMGAFLTAFANKADAVAAQKDKGGEVYLWSDLEQVVALEIPLK